MRIPDPSASSLCLILQFPLLEIFLSGFALDFLEFGPSSTQEFRCEVDAIEFSVAKITGDIIIRRELVYDGERDLFAHGEGSKELPGFECPGLLPRVRIDSHVRGLWASPRLPCSTCLGVVPEDRRGAGF